MVKVTVALYDPTLYAASFVNPHTTEAELPAVAECASAPKVATDVAAVVLDVWVPLQPVPGDATVQVYFRASPADGGLATDGPPAGEKSVVTCAVMVPAPLDGVV